jgi:translation initiation factor IF-3
VRLRAAEKFIAKGNKVKLSCQFRGREMDFQDIGRDLFMVRCVGVHAWAGGRRVRGS